MRHVYADFVDRVAVPARYLGGEYQSAVKDPAAVEARVALAFPDLYEIGMSHMGTKILYSVLNRDPRIWADRDPPGAGRPLLRRLLHRRGGGGAAGPGARLVGHAAGRPRAARRPGRA